MNTIQTPGTRLDSPDDARPPATRMTEEEFVAWTGEDVRAEWADGEVIETAPVSSEHDSLDGWLLSLLRIFVEHHDLARISGPELMVRFAELRRRRLPGVLFISKDRLEIVKPNHIEGAPDLIMEIVSPDSESRDWRVKYLEYESAGVREYWIIDPMSQGIEAYALDANNAYRRIDATEDRIASLVLPGFFVRPSWLWREKRIGILEALREFGVV